MPATEFVLSTGQSRKSQGDSPSTVTVFASQTGRFSCGCEGSCARVAARCHSVNVGSRLPNAPHISDASVWLMLTSGISSASSSHHFATSGGSSTHEPVSTQRRYSPTGNSVASMQKAPTDLFRGFHLCGAPSRIPGGTWSKSTVAPSRRTISGGQLRGLPVGGGGPASPVSRPQPEVNIDATSKPSIGHPSTGCCRCGATDLNLAGSSTTGASGSTHRVDSPSTTRPVGIRAAHLGRRPNYQAPHHHFPERVLSAKPWVGTSG